MRIAVGGELKFTVASVLSFLAQKNIRFLPTCV